MSGSNINPDDDLGLGQTLRGFAAGQKVFRRYTLRKVLGRGGMGVVWLARDEDLDREVALKFLPELVCLDKESVADLKRETRRSLELTHPHIVRIYDFVSDDRAAAISMEYVDGASLSEFKANQPGRCLDVEQLRPWVEQLCAALDYAHNRARVVHRDLKPANLMVNSRGELKVADFGIARGISDSVSRVTMSAGTSGTLLYMSPQQASGVRSAPTDDIYSLGATLYDLLAGKPPFYSGDIAHQMRAQMPPPIAERRKDLEIDAAPVPVEWEQTIMACLAKEPAQRPQSAGEVWKRLQPSAGVAARPEPLVEIKPAPSIPPPSTDQTAPPVRDPVDRRGAGSTRRTAFILVISALVLAGLAGVWLWNMRKDSAGVVGKTEQTNETRPLGEARPKVTPVETPPLGLPTNPAEAGGAKLEKRPYPALNRPWTNGLGMRFVPVPRTAVLFGAWDVRVQDYRAYASAKSGADRSWENPEYKGRKVTPTEDCPVVNVSWIDAKAFCRWLTDRERGEGSLGAGQEYRLPEDWEWSVAAGLDEPRDGTPKDKDRKIPGVYPWGTQWPPPRGAGNYADATANHAFSAWAFIEGYDDGHATTSPVGSFSANRQGLYDLGGNVSEWCEDEYSLGSATRVLRGASWSASNPDFLLSSYRNNLAPVDRYDFMGFRVVLAVGGPAQSTAAPEAAAPKVVPPPRAVVAPPVEPKAVEKIPPPADPRGGLLVNTSPAGARVILGDGNAEISPAIFTNVHVGKYPLQVSLEGYEPLTREAEIKANDFTDVGTLVLELSVGSVAVGSEPAGAEVRQGNEMLGTTPLQLAKIPSGTVEYSVLLQGYRTAKVKGTVRSKETLRLGAKLELLPYPKLDQPWTNSLGIKFAPVPGTVVLFGVWDVRVQDYRLYAQANSGVDGSWKNPGFTQGDDHPVVKVSWDDAKAFCEWLTDKERREDRITASQSYRLPMDAEWSIAVGLSEAGNGTPQVKSGKISGVYPWGTQWPPPRGAGNYGSVPHADDFVHTSPVGGFAANRFGLYDMGGNAAQWCEDEYGGDSRGRVLRGASWSSNLPEGMLSSFRSGFMREYRGSDSGFRCVLADASSQKAAETETVPSTGQGSAADTGNWVAVISTSLGDMEIALWPDVAPNTVANFKKLARQGFYDGTCFHRVIAGFMIQGGDPLTKDPSKESEWGKGGPGYTIKAEFNDRSHERGVISMARAQDPDSAGSQFFICDGAPTFLDHQYTVFGKLIKGDKVLDAIAKTPTVSPDRPKTRININSIRIVPAKP